MELTKQVGKEQRRAQLIAQCKAVAHMAHVLSGVHTDLMRLYEVASDAAVEFAGPLAHRRMEALGDLLNGMDAVTDKDAWIDGVFDGARQIFPLAECDGAS